MASGAGSEQISMVASDDWQVGQRTTDVSVYE
jgi:hypothetical protein